MSNTFVFRGEQRRSRNCRLDPIPPHGAFHCTDFHYLKRQYQARVLLALFVRTYAWFVHILFFASLQAGIVDVLVERFPTLNNLVLHLQHR